MESTLIRLDHIEVYAGKTRRFGPVSLAVEAGECLGVAGPNGAGKSTLLNLLSGRLVPDRGRVTSAPEIDGRDHRRRRGYLAQHQDYRGDLPLTVLDVVLFGRLPLRSAGQRFREEDRKAARASLDRLGLKSLESRLFRELSGGEQRKVHIARILAQDPQVLFLDEPCAGLDLRWQEEVTRCVADLHGEGRYTTVMVTHDLARLPATCSRIALIRDGQLLALGKPEDILKEETLEPMYGCPVRVEKEGGRFFVHPAAGERL
ncbi:MAG TPA: ABC transporter ATP-binding protein [Thermoanaerobaculia bacterium]|nr:ABC transporter ATP-binding protein [Thermoanaerobaculia bacterium]HUM30873.1 ABC transporter ATP-binding protein [Thermoanaerobaculia bacterium]HXK69226.1 ABC transporter ATP-binding protein [Thermoanaerobaculia bacterium]